MFIFFWNRIQKFGIFNCFTEFTLSGMNFWNILRTWKKRIIYTGLSPQHTAVITSHGWLLLMMLELASLCMFWNSFPLPDELTVFLVITSARISASTSSSRTATHFVHIREFLKWNFSFLAYVSSAICCGSVFSHILIFV